MAVGLRLRSLFRADVAFFFYLGGVLRLHKTGLGIDPRATTVLLAAFIVLVALRALAPMVIDVVPERPALLDMATRALRLLGVFACWGLCLRIASTRLGARIAQYSGLSFFLFATHFPLIAVMKQLLWPWLPDQTDLWMIHYGASVTLTIALGLAAGLLLARTAPGWFALMNGGRAVPVAAPSVGRAVAPVS